MSILSNNLDLIEELKELLQAITNNSIGQDLEFIEFYINRNNQILNQENHREEEKNEFTFNLNKINEHKNNLKNTIIITIERKIKMENNLETKFGQVKNELKSENLRYQAREEIKRYATNKFDIIGNINHKRIYFNEEKGVASFSVAVQKGKDKISEWFNVSYFKKKEGEDKLWENLKSMDTKEKAPQIQIQGVISHNKVEKDGEIKNYTNFTVFDMKETLEFQRPQAKIELTGRIAKTLLTAKEGDHAYFQLATTEGKEGEFSKFHSINTFDSVQKTFLTKFKEGEQVSLKADIHPQGFVNLKQTSQVLAGTNFHLKLSQAYKEALNNNKDQER